MIRALISLSLVLVISCSKSGRIETKTHTDMSPQSVNASKVESILVPENESQIDVCSAEVNRVGAKVLYRNDLGLLMLDKKASEIQLTACKAMLTDNVEIKLESKPVRSGGKLADLPTLLRLIPAEEIGARSFIKENPTFDGRGAVVAILDTGVEVDHPMLTQTTTGEAKVVDFEDFSGEGRLSLTPANEAQLKLVQDITGTDFQMTTFKGSTLAQAEEVSAQDNFSDILVITYLDSNGKRKLRIDTNGDEKFADELELSGFGESHLFTKIGAKKTLTVSVQVAEDGKTATLCFDDGSHGTHVAGITAGYDPKGLSGVAPGAKVLAAKIGDNRLSGGSTTTASMMLAIDYAALKKADIVNLSYGIAAGSNVGKSTIDKYIDKVAQEKGILFSISAGNAGPGLLTVGTPAGANLAITNGAYVSKQTARDNYGYAGVEDDTTWFFSSVGPRQDGGLKPTLLAPGSALASVPKWKGLWANYRGTSMASPQTTGGLALLLSAATQTNLPKDRASVTRAVYDSAKKVSGLSLIEQGHGLFNVPGALKVLEKRKSELAIEYNIAVNSPTTPDGKGAGIYVRSRSLPENTFTVSVTPVFPSGTSEEAKNELKTYRLEASDSWIKPVSNLWITSAPKTFQVEVSKEVFSKAGLRSGKVTAILESTNEVAFVLPVTVVSPVALQDSNGHKVEINEAVKVGETKRYFVDVPAGTTAIQLDLVSDGPIVWGQLLDPEGRKLTELRDVEASAPQPPLFASANIQRAGVYEIDLVAPAYNKRRAQVRLNTRVFSFTTRTSPATTGKGFDLLVQNNFESLKIVSNSEVRHFGRSQVITVNGDTTKQAIEISADELTQLGSLHFNVKTSKRFYDLMTDYPYRVFNTEGAMIGSGGLELDSAIPLDDLSTLTQGKGTLEITGAFSDKAPEKWFFELVENRVLKTPIAVAKGARLLLETGQEGVVQVPLDSVSIQAPAGLKPCVVILLETADAKKIQDVEVCY